MRISPRTVYAGLLCLSLAASVALAQLEGLDHVSLSVQESHNERLRIVKQVNIDETSTWKAGINEYFRGRPQEFTRRLCGARRGGELLPLKTAKELGDEPIPEEFDSRTKWPDCPTIKEIRDQSACGSCWAISAAEVASDRLCAVLGIHKRISTTDILACCSNCGFGCSGGYPSLAWKWLAKQGAVTGGDYGDYSLCKAYPFPMCDHHQPNPKVDCAQFNFRTPKCLSRCDSNSTYVVPYQQERTVFKNSYSLRGEEAIQREIMRYGPVEATFEVFSDFEVYKSGVYQHKTGAHLGSHAVKIIGWGVDNGVKYWTIANSWNTGWGEGGFFRILRGVNHLNIEGDVVAGMPVTN